MGDDEDVLAFMFLDNREEGGKRSGCDRKSAFTAGGGKGIRIIIPGSRFFWKFFLDLRPGHLLPVTVGNFTEIRAGMNIEPMGFREDLGGFNGASEGGSPYRGNFLTAESCGESSNLFSSVIRKGDIGCTSKTVFGG
jgi:hypothetical protein